MKVRQNSNVINKKTPDLAELLLARAAYHHSHEVTGINAKANPCENVLKNYCYT
jgi:hypothetical protein